MTQYAPLMYVTWNTFTYVKHESFNSDIFHVKCMLKYAKFKYTFHSNCTFPYVHVPLYRNKIFYATCVQVISN